MGAPESEIQGQSVREKMIVRDQFMDRVTPVLVDETPLPFLPERLACKTLDSRIRSLCLYSSPL